MAFGGHVIWVKVFTMLKRIGRIGSYNYGYKEFLYTFNPRLSKSMRIVNLVRVRIEKN